MFSYTVQVRTIKNPRTKVVAFASLLINDVLSLEGFRIIDGAKGLFVSAPSHKGKNKEGEDTWYDDVRFVGDDAEAVKEEIYKSVLQAYTDTSTSRESAAEAQASVNDTESSMTRRPLW